MIKRFLSIALLTITYFQLIVPAAVSPEQSKTFQTAIQQYCFDSYELFTRVNKGDKSNQIATGRNKLVIEAQDLFKKDIDAIRAEFFTDQDEVKAITHFTNHLLILCKQFGVRKFKVLSFPSSVEETTPIDTQLSIIKNVLSSLLPHYASLKPLPPLHQQIANILLYNFLSTKVLPKVINGGGYLLSAYLFKQQVSAFINGFDGRLPFLRYRQINHNDTTPETNPNQNEPNNFYDLLNMFTNQAQSKPQRPCDKGGISGLFNVCNHNDCNRYTEREPVYNSTTRSWNYIERPSGHHCGNATEPCYSCEGLNLRPSAGGTARFAWAGRATLPALALRYLAQLVEEYQLPEYERRIKDKQKIAEEARIANQRKFLKINYETQITFDKVKGQKEIIDSELRILVDYLKHPFKYKNSSSGTRSVLFYGPPGNGKTLLARAIAKESGAPFLEITADDIINENSKEKIMATWRMAEEVAAQRPEKSAIIYIDEVDTVVGNRSKNANLDPERAKALSNLLSIFDGIEKRNPYLHVVIILTTNHHENLDPALLRPGRIDRKILIGKPSEAGRKEFLQALLPQDQHNLIDDLAARTKEFSGAQMVNVVDTANMLASYENHKKPTAAHYHQAINRFGIEISQMPVH